MSAIKFLTTSLLALGLATNAFAVNINEIRIDMPGTDNDEYVELAGVPGESLDGITYLVIGDLAAAPRCGGIECVIDLSGLTILADGLLVIGDSGAAGPHTFVYDIERDLNFENSDNVTHMIVSGFSGLIHDDIDVDDDCVIDPMPPWGDLLDSVGLDEGVMPDCLGSDECLYGGTYVGPDSSFVPGHVYLCGMGWQVGDFILEVNDTPGAPNNCELPPPDPLATLLGYDPHDSFVVFGSAGLPAIPADFFGPGSDPFQGGIALHGTIMDEELTGNASTIVQRNENPFDPTDPVGATGEIHTEILELNLVSIQPITVTYNGGQDPEEWDLAVVDLSPVIPPPGTLSGVKTHENGGVFSSSFHVQPRFVFVRVSDGMSSILDTGLEGIAYLELDASDGSWVHEVEPSLEIIAPSNGWFVPGVDEVLPGDPTSQCPTRLHANEASGAMRLTLTPARHAPPNDPLVTVPGDQPAGTHLQFDAPSNMPIPADFFDPGSEPFWGDVLLRGEPLGGTWPYPEDLADTLIRRSGDPFDRCEPPSAEVREVPIELVALDLRSIEPITVHYGGSYTELWEVQVGLPLDPPSTGTLVTTKTHANGGVFESTFYVLPVYTFTRISDGAVRVLDTAAEGRSPLVMQGNDGHWVHTLSPTLEIAASSAGKFVPGVEEVIPGDPSSQQVRSLHCIEAQGAGQHTLIPVPLVPTAAPETPVARMSVRIFPNPFNPSTRIEFSMRERGPVSVAIYDARGAFVRTLIDAVVPAGVRSVTWSGIDHAGSSVASGVYFYRLRAPSQIKTGKIVRVE